MEYQDFELEIQPGRGCDYPVAVLHSPAGEARAVMRFPFDRLALENRLDKLQIALLRSGGRQRSTLSAEEQAVRDFGTALFNAIFTDDIRSRYDVSRERTARDEQGLRLKLRIAAPDGSKLLLGRILPGKPGAFSVHLIPLDTPNAAAVPLATELQWVPFFAFSPDATQIMYESDSEGARGLWVRNADGSHPRRLPVDVSQGVTWLGWW